ncbi:hypothetical protein ONE63_001212 [Megalurothrips usitatus]|uniref:Essential protein Yae1 N-terminal domain-containing protein n=1 Tax=Megalurothrips usitatus TaxID=439358 RepID=A0AAV7XF76_9NEOP|nr:hypothetical protein ONE63_001212 [Megalurothrips usitatus]
MESDTEADFGGKEDFSSKQEFSKIQRNLISSGFREGAAAGKDAAFQSGFDAGYATGFEAGFSLGKWNGCADTLSKNASVFGLDASELVDCEFKNARHGLCQICKGKVNCCKNPKDNSALIKTQKDVVTKALEEQRSKFHLVFEKAGVREPLVRDQEKSEDNQIHV